MKKLLLLLFLVPVIHAENTNAEVTDFTTCELYAGQDRYTMEQLKKCKTGDLLLIKPANMYSDVSLAIRICVIDSIKFSNSATICKYTGSLRNTRE
ncbi:MAG: hypothetical protein ACJ0FE_00330 [Gammaproteobacteria bacterium]|tara:strand:+ start:281 stop:568 length:288 start_codon:yes stop_codon:yes gene_type:complete